MLTCLPHAPPAPAPTCRVPPQGTLYCDRMKPAVLDTVRADLVALEEEFIAQNPGVKVQRLMVPKVKVKGFG